MLILNPRAITSAEASGRIGIVWLELSSECAIEAREISRTLGRSSTDLDSLIIAISDLTRQLTVIPDPLCADAGFILLQLELRKASERLQRVLAQSRSRYDVGED